MSTHKLETSVIIIGAGPAGAGASFFLSKYGIPHIVIEKETFPRDKVCGDACSGKTALVINRANPAWLAEILSDDHNFLPSWGITFIAPNGKKLDIPFTATRIKETKAPGFTVPRLQLDDFLFRKMPSPYCTIYQDAKVNSIDSVPGMVNVSMTHKNTEYTVTAPVIVGADGDKSIVRKKYLSENTSPED